MILKIKFKHTKNGRGLGNQKMESRLDNQPARDRNKQELHVRKRVQDEYIHKLQELWELSVRQELKKRSILLFDHVQQQTRLSISDYGGKLQPTNANICRT